MKRTFLYGALAGALLVVGGFLALTQWAATGQAAPPETPQAGDPADTWTCPHGDVDEMRGHMDSMHGGGTFDSMHPDGAMPHMGPATAPGDGSQTNPGGGPRPRGGGMMGSGGMMQ